MSTKNPSSSHMLIFNSLKENDDDCGNVDDHGNIDDDCIENDNYRDSDDTAQLGSDGFFFPSEAFCIEKYDDNVLMMTPLMMMVLLLMTTLMLMVPFMMTTLMTMVLLTMTTLLSRVSPSQLRPFLPQPS